MAPLVSELRLHPEFQTIICVTGQHRQMLDQVLTCFNIVPDYDLEIMRENQTLFDVTATCLLRLHDLLLAARPDVILVHGDTTTAFAASLAAFYLQIPVGHVEAGLRTHNLASPFPEEFNRQVVDIIASYYYAPTQLAKENLLSEGKSENVIFVTGNTAIDAMKTTVRDDYEHPMLDWAKESRLILVTAHRRENLGIPLQNMFRAIKRIAEEFSDVKILYPVHCNPLVRSAANSILGDHDRVRLVEPLDVVDFHNIMARSYMILTDSGGIQEEAPSLGKPVLVMRDTTERPEGIEAGTLRLVGTDEDRIYRTCHQLLSNENEYQLMTRASNPYGDGNACVRIVKSLLKL